MRGGSYVVVRRIRIALEHWDQMKSDSRNKRSGATRIPVRRSAANEFEPTGSRRDRQGRQPVIPENSHVRLAAPASNDGAQILRRPYSYNDGVEFHRRALAALASGHGVRRRFLFVCYQRDPRTGFIKIFDNMSKFDMMNQFVTHTGGGLFACPGGIAKGEFIGQRLFEQA